jgi:putative DNA primase/helicase
MTSLLEWALTYASAGYRVFPLHTMRNSRCSCGGLKACKSAKHPVAALAPRGLLNATNDPDIITEWWSKMPDANIGIATGKASNLIVLDIDGPEGEALLAKYAREHGPLPPTATVKTSKGWHIYFAYPKNVPRVKSVAREKLKLDVRGDGGYVVAPPSIHESGHVYAFKGASLEKPVECPAWVVAYANRNGDGDGNLKGVVIPRAASRNTSTPKPRGGTALTVAAAKVSTLPPHTAAEEAKLQSALRFIPADERDIWLRVGMALHWTGWGEAAFQIWNDWSRSAPEKYHEADQRKTWESFDREYAGAPITLGTLFDIATKYGWKDRSGTVEKLQFQTDVGNARRLVQRHGKNIRYVHAWRKWLIWDRLRWRTDEDGGIVRFAEETIEAIHTDAAGITDERERSELRKHALRSSSAPRIEAMVALAQSELAVVLPVDQIDADPWLLGVCNGVVELRTGAFREARPEDYITRCANLSFDASAQCPAWRAFLATVTGGDTDLMTYLQRVAGYVLTGSAREEVLFVLYGTGQNGKSTFRQMLHDLLGDYAMGADAGLLMTRQASGSATPERARLKGMRLVSINESAEDGMLNEEGVKHITSQDTITARPLYAAPFDFIPSHKTFLTTNHRPVVRGSDQGIWRRIHLLPFDQIIPEHAVEPDFRGRRLVPETAGILNWMLVGLAAYLKDGLNPPRAVVEATEAYRDDMDVIGDWLDERCVEDAAAVTPAALLHPDYRLFAEREIGKPLSVRRFVRELVERGFKRDKGTGGRRSIRGLRLRPVGSMSLSVVRSS